MSYVFVDELSRHELYVQRTDSALYRLALITHVLSTLA